MRSSGTPKYDLTGVKFGKLLPLEYLGKGNWNCLCDCGREKTVKGNHLRSGKVVSCGCYHAEKQREAKVNRAGVRYGRLTAIRRIEGQRWLCKCDCGAEVIADGRNLGSGHTKSCGCLKIDHSKKMLTTHGESKTRLYGVWSGMIKRCYDVNCRAYRDYGGRGISICDEWRHDFVSFKNWASSTGYNPAAPKGACTIERIDVDGNYCPENCCWIPLSEQAKNKRNSRRRSSCTTDGPGSTGRAMKEAG